MGGFCLLIYAFNVVRKTSWKTEKARIIKESFPDSKSIKLIKYWHKIFFFVCYMYSCLSDIVQHSKCWTLQYKTQCTALYSVQCLTVNSALHCTLLYRVQCVHYTVLCTLVWQFLVPCLATVWDIVIDCPRLHWTSFRKPPWIKSSINIGIA